MKRKRREFSMLFAGGAGGGGGIFFGEIVPDSIDCEEGTLQVEVSSAPDCTVPDGGGYDGRTVDVFDPCDKIGYHSIVMSRAIADIEGSGCFIVRLKNLDEGCEAEYLLLDICGYLECG